ncbi:metallophosphoesterase family protein [Weissella paramesenteroides]|uniref:metallophosphoesterase family protein n=1 Tax=Weissella paramesenteroides TaxID=1249 RepID=UPI00123C47BF|nr:exonuclease SbcCD subunit D [Weissella paramesenteroides]KAA8455810.1 exonuclease SbcCD subunit D [Weissella paramesenteroides]KAA8457150.1 exonuclease SbcCD subunit D [Weissella paramesenteroides]KAA8457725.1 exonuclease SbcCD subunit D [Weissella paramesenteroides]KAA8460280.1 exonuclease SbcCD subunit D [Weissella paramesenteroides]KAA8461248.1 exonuclease SbcCD subunit D [Weissella paramesenteroides]
MKFLHTADWHIGKELGGYSLLAEQQTAYQQIRDLAVKEEVDGVIIAGDLYDRGIAPISAVNSLEGMLKDLNITFKMPIYAVSGNHDGATRLGAGREWREKNQLYLNTTLADAFKPIETQDTQIFLLPFIEPSMARVYYSITEDEASQYQTINQVMPRIVSEMVAQFKPEMNHVLVTHYYVVGSKNQDYEFTSETNSQVGGLRGLDDQLFQDFDYVALGHLHLRQASPSDVVQYSGSPIKFNTKEAQSEKGVYIVEIKNHQVRTSWHPLLPKKDLILLTGTFEQLIDADFYQQYERGHKNYFSIKIQGHVTATNARAMLTEIYGDVVEVQYDLPKLVQNRQDIREIKADDGNDDVMIANFYQFVTGKQLNNNQKKLIDDTLSQLHQQEEEN